MEKKKQTGLYYTALGGMNLKWVSAMCNVITSVSENPQTGALERVSVIKDIGGYDGKKAFGNTVYKSVIPEVTPWLQHREHDRFPDHEKASILLLTHCHTDHIPPIELIKQGYVLPPVYGDPFTLAMFQSNLANARIPMDYWPEFQTIEPEQELSFGQFKITAMAASHSVPTLGFWFRNEAASIYDTGDCAIAPVNGYSTNLAHIEMMRQISPRTVCFFDACNANQEGASLSLDQTRQIYETEIDKNPAKQVVALVSGGNIDQMIMVVGLAAKYNKKLVMAGDNYMKGNFSAAQQNMNLGKKYPGLEIIDSSDTEALKAVNPDNTVVMCGQDFGNGSWLVSALEGKAEGIELGQKPTVIYPELFLKDHLRQQIEQSGGRTKEILGATSHGTAADITSLLHVVDAAVNVPNHCGAFTKDLMNDMLKAEGLNSTQEAWGNGNTWLVRNGQIKRHSYQRPLWRCFAQNDGKISEDVHYQDSEDSTKLTQGLDFTDYQRSAKKIKQTLWPGIQKDYPEIYNRIIRKQNASQSVLSPVQMKNLKLGKCK